MMATDSPWGEEMSKQAKGSYPEMKTNPPTAMFLKVWSLCHPVSHLTWGSQCRFQGPDPTTKSTWSLGATF